MRFVTSESKTLHLKNGKDWIEVKNELSVGENKRYRSSGFRHVSGVGKAATEDDVRIEVKWDEVAFARVEAYLTAWSDKRPLTRAAIEALCDEDFEEIDNLIQKHIEALAEEKKARQSESQTISMTT
jgi:hypothetical protein